MPRPDRVVTTIDDTGLAAVFGGRRAFDHFHGLNGIDGNLIGEDFALPGR